MVESHYGNMSPPRSRELDSVVLLCLFQLKIVYDSISCLKEAKSPVPKGCVSQQRAAKFSFHANGKSEEEETVVGLKVSSILIERSSLNFRA